MEYIGTDLKYLFSSSGDFSFDDEEWDMVFMVGNKRATMTKRNAEGAYILTCDAENMGCKPLSDGSWVFLLDSSYFGAGRLYAVLYAQIPDADFDPTSTFSTLDSYRREVKKFSLETIIDL